MCIDLQINLWRFSNLRIRIIREAALTPTTNGTNPLFRDSGDFCPNTRDCVAVYAVVAQAILAE
jgi:hypothetical protein